VEKWLNCGSEESIGLAGVGGSERCVRTWFWFGGVLSECHSAKTGVA